MKNAFLIAAASSGSGKTTLSLGLMRSFVRNGVAVQPFKCGPDYIDTQYHRVATGRDSINLDLFMASGGHVRNLFDSCSVHQEVGIVEGAMGMFDGFDRMKGSPADVARLLDIPVVLLIDAASAAFSVAATIYGFTRFDPGIRVAGVIFNRVASANHYRYLLEACRATGVRPLGYVGRNDGLRTPSRHLGLTLGSSEEMARFVDLAADEVERNVDVAALLEQTVMTSRALPAIVPPMTGCRVAVARDEAFNFIYPANIAAFGGEITYFSPLRDSCIPEADLVYLPGGYPELYARELAANLPMRDAVRQYAEEGKRMLAECGGMIYLSEQIDGEPMCGVLPLKTTMEGARLRLGYRRIVLPGMELRGHEFHYSRTVPTGDLSSVGVQFDARGKEVSTPLYRYKNVFAGYTHIYWGETDIFRLWKI